MKTKGKVVEWFSADRMHDMSKNWLSDLNFIKDEQVFLEELITDYTKKIIDSKNLERAQTATTALYRTKRGNQKLINDLIEHEQQLRLMVDGKDEIDKETMMELYMKLQEQVFKLNNLIKPLLDEAKRKNRRS